MNLFRKKSGKSQPSATKTHDASCPCEALQQKAVRLIKEQKYQEAAQVYDQVLEIHPEAERAWSNKGVCLDALGDNDKALECLNKAIDFNPNYVFALSTKAAMLAIKGELDEASTLMDRVLDINPEFEDVLVNKGRLLIDQGRHLDSIPFFDRCLRVNPRNARSLLFKAVAAIENYVRRYPDTNPFNRPSTDKEHLRHLELLMASAGLLTKSLKINPGDRQALRYLAILLSLMNHPGAEPALHQALQMDPADETIKQYLRKLKGGHP